MVPLSGEKDLLLFGFSADCVLDFDYETFAWISKSSRLRRAIYTLELLVLLLNFSSTPQTTIPRAALPPPDSREARNTSTLPESAIPHVSVYHLVQ